LPDLENIQINSYFIILPLCKPFYNKYNIYNKKLIDNKNGMKFTLKIMKRLMQISDFLEKNYNIINLDFKLNNFMFSTDKNNLIMIDFSIIKKITKIRYHIDNNYYIWPDSKSISVEYIPSYCTCINGLELLFGYSSIINIRNDNKIDYYLKIIKEKDKDAYNIFFHGLVLKITTQKFLTLFADFI
jgi:hypothetical protein